MCTIREDTVTYPNSHAKSIKSTGLGKSFLHNAISFVMFLFTDFSYSYGKQSVNECFSVVLPIVSVLGNYFDKCRTMRRIKIHIIY